MKKKLPLELVKGFNPEYGNAVVLEYGKDSNRIVIFKDIDPESDFFFEIKEIKAENSKLLVKFKPANRNTVNATASWFTIEELNAHFKMWIALIEEYNSSETIFDDPIVKSFEKEFLDGIDFAEPDADIKPFPVEIILRLDEHLEKIQNEIEAYKDGNNDVEIVEIKELSSSLRQDLSKKSKKQVFRKLANIWAKIAKQGPKTIKAFLTEGGKLIVKESVKFLLGRGLEMLG